MPVLSGCVSIGPDYVAPEPDLGEAWQQEADEKVSSELKDASAWWNEFNDPVLTELIEIGREENKVLHIAGLRVYEARALLGIATGLRYPQVQQMHGGVGAVSLSENGEPLNYLPDAVRDGADTNYTNYAVGFDSIWELDFWGKFKRTINSADANLSAVEATYDDVLITVTAELAAAYIQLRTLEERLRIARKNVATQERSYEIAGVRARNQLTTELDEQLALSLLRDTQSNIPALEAGIRATKNVISVLVGRAPGEMDTLLNRGSGIPTTADEVAIGIPTEVLRRRPDVRRAERQAAAQSERIGITKSELYPAFRLSGSFGMVADHTGDLFESDSFAGLGFLGFHWNIFNYGRIKNLVRVQDARFQQLLVNYHNTTLKAALEVEDSTNGFLKAHEETAILTEAVAASQRAVELVTLQYSDGIIGYSLVLDSQRFLLFQEDRHAAARGKTATNLVAIYKALGGGWKSDETQHFVPADIREEMDQRTNWGKFLEDSTD
jgi:NodT family efflux transporter outer membrane factor (OMF) lipoprotein